MKPLHASWTELANDCIQIILVCGTIGIALKFVTFFNHWVFFPTFPNMLDATFLIFSVSYLAWKARETQTNNFKINQLKDNEVKSLGKTINMTTNSK